MPVGSLVHVPLDTVQDAVSGVLARYPQVAAAYLFGSAIGPCRPDSDIDLGLVLSPEATEPPAWGFSGLEAQIETALGRIDGHAFEVIVLRPEAVLFSFKVIREGRLVFSRNRDVLLDFMERVARRYAEAGYRYRRALDEVLSR